MPRSSSERTTASAPVISGALEERAGGRGTAGAESAVMTLLLVICGCRMPAATRAEPIESVSAGRRAFGGGPHETGVLGKNATGIARGKRLPAGTAGGELRLVDE